MAKNTLSYILPEKKCKKCGKTFIPAPEHMYRAGSRRVFWYCSYTCYLHRNDKEKKVDDKRTT